MTGPLLSLRGPRIRRLAPHAPHASVNPCLPARCADEQDGPGFCLCPKETASASADIYSIRRSRRAIESVRARTRTGRTAGEGAELPRCTRSGLSEPRPHRNQRSAALGRRVEQGGARGVRTGRQGPALCKRPSLCRARTRTCTWAGENRNVRDHEKPAPAELARRRNRSPLSGPTTKRRGRARQQEHGHTHGEG